MDTFKEHRNRAVTRHLDLSAVPMETVIAGRNAYLNKKQAQGGSLEVVPEHEAFWFYLRNHAMAVLCRQYDPAEPLADDHRALLREYHQEIQDSALRMYYYLLQICTRESRHAGSVSTLHGAYPELANWHNSYKNTHQTGALEALFKKTPNVTAGRLTNFLSDSFYKCQYGVGYGGKKWGAIADVLKQFVHGTITAEMMLDTAWTLSHNNGPIFNKGMWYKMYDGSAIAELLDVQRAGMIPQYINDCTVGQHEGYKAAKFVTADMKAYVKAFSLISTEFTGTVDWASFKKLGALGNYSHHIKKAPPKPVDLAEKALSDAAAAQVASQKASQWQIMPGMFATKTKIDRKAQAAAAATSI